MKIIFVTREGFLLSGARVRCYNFARELKKLGLATEVFSFADNLGAPCGERELGMGFARKLGYNFRALRQLRDRAQDAVFYIQRFNYHCFAPLLISLFGKNKVIFDCDDWNIRENPEYYLGFYPSSKMEYCTRRIARFSCVCIAASRFLAEYLGKFNKNVFYIPTGADTGVFKPAPERACGPGVGFSWIGTLYHKEMMDNVRFLIDCFTRLAGRYGHITLSLAGEGSYFEDIRVYVARNRYKGRIRIEGWIAPEKIPDYLAGIDVGLLPLIQDTKFNRAKSPTKLFEYMAMGIPVVCSRLGEAETVIVDGGNGMLAGSPEECTEKMRALIEDRELRRGIGERARDTVERHYSLSVLGKRLYDIIREHGHA